MPNRKKNILVFPCGSEIGLNIYGSVRHSTHFHLIGGSSVDDHGKFVYDDYIPDIPLASSPDFIPAMAQIVADRQIDAIYPAMDFVLTILKEHEHELGCRVVTSDAETTQICLSKESTYRTLKDAIRVPKVYEDTDIPSEEFPVFVKPKIGYGAKGTRKLATQAEVNRFAAGRSDVLVVEYLPGEEYTVDCFTNKNGELLYCAARVRHRIRNGISVNTIFVEHQEEFVRMARKINATMAFRGAWFYQVKRDKAGELCLLEVASRIGGSSLLSKAIGVNLPLLSLYDIFDYDVDIIKYDYHVELDRALENKYKINLDYDSVYCDYDDCLIENGSEINTDLVKFLYQCVNQGKKIHLLSKHDGDLIEELNRFRLSGLFDSVIHIGKHENKADYIRSAKPLFIDDSYAERVNAKRRLHIPVFSPEMIDVLLK